jgi:hypothetical protein
MKVQVFHLSFKSDGNGGLMPIDGEVHAQAVKFAAENMDVPVDFTQFKEAWVACEVNGDGKPTRALGILCMVMRPDFPVCRFTDSAAVVKLVQRANDFLHDTFAARGCEVLVYVAKPEAGERMCPGYREWMELFEMKEADRWKITVR